MVQTTAIEKEAGFIQLTTLLAHSSGEWMSSDWPVCPVSETAAPHRMGAALTYARRYALFTLVGIAGEDDLDAPDLPTLELKGEVGIAPQSAASGRSSNGHASAAATTAIATSRPPRRSSIPLAKPILEADASASLRDQLLGEIAALGSNEQIDEWALRGLTAKNTLSRADAALVEVAFGEKQTKLSQCEPRTEDYPRAVSFPRSILKVSLSIPNRADCVTKTIGNLCPPSRAWYARGSRPTPITCASPSPGRSAAKSATNLPCRCAEPTIAKCIEMPKNRCGGRNWAWIPWLSPTNFGLGLIRCRYRQTWSQRRSAHLSPSPTGLPQWRRRQIRVAIWAKRTQSADQRR